MLLEFSTRHDISENDHFLDYLLIDNGYICMRPLCNLMQVSHVIRKSIMIQRICEKLACRLRDEDSLFNIGYLCAFTVSSRKYNNGMSDLCIPFMNMLVKQVPVVSSFNTKSVSHRIVRYCVMNNMIQSRILSTVSVIFSGELTMHKDFNLIKTSLDCLHRFILVVGMDMLFLGTDTKLMLTECMQETVQTLTSGIIGHYDMLSQNTHLEVLAVHILQTMCNKRNFGLIFDTLMDRFCDTISNNDTILCTFFQGVLVRLITYDVLQICARNFIEDQDIIESLISTFYAHIDSCKEIKLALCCVITECIAATMYISNVTFCRLEQVLYSVIYENPVETVTLNGNYMTLLQTGLIAYSGSISKTEISRIIQIISIAIFNNKTQQIYFSVTSCLKHIINTNRHNITKNEYANILSLIMNMYSDVKCARNFSDLLNLMKMCCMRTSVDVLSRTYEKAMCVTSMFKTNNLTCLDINNILLIVRTYFLKSNNGVRGKTVGLNKIDENGNLSSLDTGFQWVLDIELFCMEVLNDQAPKQNMRVYSSLLKTVCLLMQKNKKYGKQIHATLVLRLCARLCDYKPISSNVIKNIQQSLNLIIEFEKSYVALLFADNHLNKIVTNIIKNYDPNFFCLHATLSFFLTLQCSSCAIPSCLCEKNPELCDSIVMYAIRALISLKTPSDARKIIVQQILSSIVQSKTHIGSDLQKAQIATAQHCIPLC